MCKIIEELWNGRIIPQDMCKENDPRVKELHDLLLRNRAELEPTLSEEQKIILEKYEDNNDELISIVERRIFEQGFRLGAKLMLEILCEDKKSEFLGKNTE